MLKIYPLEAFSDNYIWVGLDTLTQNAFVVDPGDATPVITEFTKNKINLSEILITHHHFDHTGGITGLLDHFRNDIPVYSSKTSSISGVTDQLKEKDKIKVLKNTITLNVVEIPGHTLDHIAYYNNDTLFCGDTLFAAGCGRLFEGTAQQMFNSLAKLKSLPTSTKVHCAHEYTLANLKFAKTVESNNKAIDNKILQVTNLRKNNKPSLPSTIVDELDTNPFLRTKQAEIVASAIEYTNKKNMSEIEVFEAIREIKDSF